MSDDTKSVDAAKNDAAADEDVEARPERAVDLSKAPVPLPPVARRVVEPIGLRAVCVGVVAGFAVTSIVGAIAMPIFSRPKPLPLALARDAFDLALTTSVGLFWGALLSLGLWAARRAAPSRAPWLGFFAQASVATWIVFLVLGPAIAHQANTAFNGAFARPLQIGMLVGVGLGLPLAHLIGVLASRWPWVARGWMLLALAGAFVNASLFRDDFFESHAIGAWASAVGFGGACARPLGRWLERHVLWRRTASVLCLLTLGVAIFPPGNRLRLELFGSPIALGAWAHAAVLWRVPTFSTDGCLPIDPKWLDARDDAPSIPPSAPRLVDGSPIVVLVTIDAVRADVILDDDKDSMWPNLARLKRTGAVFTQARSAGSQTAISLTTLFSARYFSELYWSMHGEGASRFDYAADDPAVRFPELLGAHGVSTAKFGAIKFLSNDFGIAKGFADDVMLVTDRRHAFADEVIEPLVTRLRKAGPEPLFLYVHLMEPHAPYDRGTLREGTPFERYESEISQADQALGRIVRATASAKIDRRVLLIVSADHGEAFGEHGTFEHTKTLYEELIRVPLVVVAPHVLARRIDVPVSLVDLGPTILDVFGVDTPGSFMGQSLVPTLVGARDLLSRPILAEGRLRRALVSDGIKVITDERRKVIEAFDLRTDPGELTNLFDGDPSRALPVLAALQRFYAAHQCRRPGYEPVYKP